MPYERITQKQWETLRELIDPAEWSTISTFMSQREASDLIFLHGHRRAMERIERNTKKYAAKPVVRYTLEERLAFLAKVEAEFAAKQAEEARIKAEASSRPYSVQAPLVNGEKAATESAAPPGQQSALMLRARPIRTANITAPLFPFRKRRNVFIEIVPPPEVPATEKQQEALSEFYTSEAIAKMGRDVAANELFYRLQPLFYAGRPGLKPTRRQKRFLERYGLWKNGMSRADAGFTIATMYYRDLQ